MANTSGPGSQIDRLVELAQKAGKWGIAGLCCLMAQSLIAFAIHPVTLQGVGDLLGTMGICLTLIGVLANTKRGNDMTATIGAESKIDRAVVASELAPNAVPVVARSADPAVDREIKKQINGGDHPAAEVMNMARAVARDSKH